MNSFRKEESKLKMYKICFLLLQWSKKALYWKKKGKTSDMPCLEAVAWESCRWAPVGEVKFLLHLLRVSGWA